MAEITRLQRYLSQRADTLLSLEEKDGLCAVILPALQKTENGSATSWTGVLYPHQLRDAVPPNRLHDLTALPIAAKKVRPHLQR